MSIRSRTAEAEWAQAGRHASGALHRKSNPAQTQQASLCDERCAAGEASKRFMLAYSRALAAADFELFWEDQVNPRCLDVPLLHSHMPCLAISDPSCLRPLARLPLSNGSNSASASSHCGAYSRPTARAQPSLSIHPQLQHLFAHSSASATWCTITSLFPIGSTYSRCLQSIELASSL